MTETKEAKPQLTIDARLLKRKRVLAIDEMILKLRDAKASISVNGDALPMLRQVQGALADLVVPANG